MEKFDPILNWTLKVGSHPFPGPDGGTCINEAAIVAAGFPYQQVRTVECMPECFSRPICSLAAILNDQATDEERQRLLPFVTRRACADTPEVEKQRAAYISRSMGWSESRTFAIELSVLPIGGAVLAAGRIAPDFDRGLEVLDGALAIGRQADPFPAYEVQTRLEAMKVKAAVPEPDEGYSILGKVKSWLAIKGTTADT